MTSALEVKNLNKKYGNFLALDNVNITINGGKIIGLLGPNGSGKSTFFKCVSGLLTYEGQILVHGRPVGAESKKIVAFLPERTYLDLNMRVCEVFDFFFDFYDDFDVNRAYELLATLGVDRNAKLKTLSKGTKEKVQLIAVMARKAQVYLLDEPIGGVDPAAREFIIHTILTRVNEGATIIISTHLIRDIEDILDEYIFINGSKFISYGSVKDVHDQGKTVDEVFREVFRCF
ncbi:MAG: ABC transporter ATP-binding protein [Clostridia bacterium]|nr:ABC transporter ATP-binding protein [Clostridia bacterium]